MKSYTEDTELLLHDAAPGTVVRALRVTSDNSDAGHVRVLLMGGH